MTQVYFVDDVTDMEWKVVRLKEPRSRRALELVDDDFLSASGSSEATHQINRGLRDTARRMDNGGESVLRADVVEGTNREDASDDDDEEAYGEFDEEQDNGPVQGPLVPDADSTQHPLPHPGDTDDFDIL
ncbi:hypothetical protein KC19_VG304700 [Ceratodon purpureus]|uniref:Uncharacterized protein n=1 Tax=Ceratodon purpureus TaxID=3225 RepID=A0A8T0HVS6_CERPU|nr:hypothetical protein KC19_VG304700 [Ceratodon purpureus]